MCIRDSLYKDPKKQNLSVFTERFCFFLHLKVSKPLPVLSQLIQTPPVKNRRRWKTNYTSPSNPQDEKPTGVISDPILWDNFQLDGHKTGGMTAEKLYKTETLERNAPILSFGIERPYSMVIGSSTRAEKQFWPLNLDTLTKTSSSVGHQQILPG